MTAPEAAEVSAVREAESPLHRAGHIGDEVGAGQPGWIANYAEPFSAPDFEPWNLPGSLCRPFLYRFDEAGEPAESLAPASAENIRAWLDQLPGECGVLPADRPPWLYEGELIAWERAQAFESQRSHGPMAIAQGPLLAGESAAPRFVPADDTSVDLPAIGELDEDATGHMTKFMDLHDALGGEER